MNWLLLFGTLVWCVAVGYDALVLSAVNPPRELRFLVSPPNHAFARRLPGALLVGVAAFLISSGTDEPAAFFLPLLPALIIWEVLRRRHNRAVRALPSENRSA
ncbi:MAG: hypothetical protein M3P91_12265 [Actinomycetota bacterium]|nr:hypothetical protein [Actinomycetota bacterium]